MIFIITSGTSKLLVGSSVLCHPAGQVFSEWAPRSHRVQARPGKDNPRTRRTAGAFPHIISFNLHSHLAGRVIISSSTTSKFFTRYSQILFLKFIYLFLAGLGFLAVHRLSLGVVRRGYSLLGTCAYCGDVSCCRAQAGSAALAPGLSCSWACGIFPDQGSNLYALYWQADSSSLYHQGSPRRYSQILIPKQMCIFKYCTWKVGGWGQYLFNVHFFLLQYKGNNDPQCLEMGFCRNAHLLR